MTFRVLALCGSLRAESSNAGLIKMAQRFAPTDLQIEWYRGIVHLPYYNADLDKPGSEPASVLEFRHKIDESDAVLIATPEYNAHLPAVIKNAFDWASRPLGAQAFKGKIVSSMSSGGGGGGARALVYLDTMVPYFGNTVVNEPQVELKKGADYLHADGTTTDPAVEELVRARLDAILAALRSR